MPALIALQLAGAAATANAQSGAPPTGTNGTTGSTARSTIERYVADAMRGNLSIAAARTGVARAGAATREARGRYLPSVGVNARYSEYSGTVNIGDFINPAYAALNQLIGDARFPTNIDATLPQRQDTKIELVQPLFAPALRAASAAAAANRDAAVHGLGANTRRLAADVQHAWLALATTERVIATLATAATVLDEGLRVSERLVSAGQATPDAVLRARAERSENQQQLADARRQRDAARRGFNLLLDRDGDAAVDVSFDSTLSPAIDRPVSELEAYALAHREELEQAAAGERIAAAQQRAASSAFLPTVALSASYGVQGERYRFDRQNDVALASLVLSWNVFNGGQDVARREQASFAQDEARIRMQQAERAVRLEVRNAYDAVVAARVVVTAAADRLASAERAFALVERRYANGLATQIEFLSARAAFTAAALNDVITRYGLAARAVDLERAAATRVLP